MKAVVATALILAVAACSQADDAPALPVVGSVCGDTTLRGDNLGDIEGPGGCGIEDAVLLRAVSGVTLSSPARVNCETANALKTWIDTGARPAVGDTGGGISSLRVVASYSCRSRNSQPGARLSEHSFGNAIDIAAIGLENGTEMSVLTDWNGSRYSAQLRRMWQAACGPFGTVLGPDADRFHQDHFHFDVADHGNGSFCR